ncbi:MAG: hypothetical protein OEU09_09465 [Rhodospirillales bacterium]|nr:hypothetical protein [Rhodospirillales bacterium]MDH3911514.1 hypothetical protein [Rhodospirillales bacterium]MDH3965950.1 hypothetical protein [Rhodospirillales bacterium]
MAVSAPGNGNSARQVCIVGCGAVTAVGVDAPMTAASVRANVSRFKGSYLIDKTGEPMLLSMAEFIDDDIRNTDRLNALAAVAAREAMAPLTDGPSGNAAASGVGLCLGMSAARPGLHADAADILLSRLAADNDLPLHGKKRIAVSTGHAATLMSIAKALEWIGSGKEDLILVGGVESYFDPDTLEWLDEDKRLHSEANKDGFVPGEGAGFCLLASADFAQRNNLDPFAFVLSGATAEEPSPFVSDDICIGQGMTQVLRKALDVLNPQDAEADWVLCDLNGESFRSKEWTYGYLRTGARHRDPLEIWHPADCYGDIGAASGGVLVSIAIAAWRRKYARGDRCLIWTSSDDKQRAAVLLQNASIH